MLTQEEISRYSRHLIMPEVGVEGQEKLKAAKVLLIGTGGLGAPVAMYLAAAGVGTIGLVDFDVVDVSNLQRQVIHGTKDIGKKKIDSAEETMRDINPLIKIIKHEVALTSANALEILKDYDIIADGTDNFPTRFLINDACVMLGKPNVYASIFRFEGQATIFAAEGGPCYRCLYPEPPPPGLVPSCAEGGVLGILPGVVGLLQATEVVKLILGAGEPLIGRLMLYDALAMKFRELKLRKNPECICATGEVKLIDYEQFCGIPKQPEPPPMSAEISPKDVKTLIDAKENFILIDVREPHEFQIGRIPTSTLIPLGDLPKKVAELDPSANYVLHCKMGGRSAKGCDVLRQAGFKNVRNMTGGILAWSDQVDPSVPKY
jgi:molybdopterin/thiamine biosynthesis adenylyltransferase/rhodanese-related sulfurtransferase